MVSQKNEITPTLMVVGEDLWYAHDGALGAGLNVPTVDMLIKFF